MRTLLLVLVLVSFACNAVYSVKCKEYIPGVDKGPWITERDVNCPDDGDHLCVTDYDQYGVWYSKRCASGDEAERICQQSKGGCKTCNNYDFCNAGY